MLGQRLLARLRVAGSLDLFQPMVKPVDGDQLCCLCVFGVGLLMMGFILGATLGSCCCPRRGRPVLGCHCCPARAPSGALVATPAANGVRRQSPDNSLWSAMLGLSRRQRTHSGGARRGSSSSIAMRSSAVSALSRDEPQKVKAGPRPQYQHDYCEICPLPVGD